MIKKSFKYLLDLIEVVLPGVLLVLIFLLFLLEVFSRYLFKISILWAQELTPYAYLWLVFLGASFAERKRENIVFSYIYDSAPPIAKLIFDAITHMVIAIMFVILIPSMINFYKFYFKIPTISLKISLGIAYLCVPIFLILMIPRELYRSYISIRAICIEIIKHLRGKENEFFITS